MQPTNPNQFTEKAWEAIAHTPDVAKQYQQQQLESEHLMKGLLEQEGLASAIFTKAGTNLQKVRDRTEQFIQRQPKVSGTSASVYLGRSLDTLLDQIYQLFPRIQKDFPAGSYEKAILKIDLGCATYGCCAWDYTYRGFFSKKISDSSYKDIEVARLITPYSSFMRKGRHGYDSTWVHPYFYDVTDYLPLLKGDSIFYSAYTGGWDDKGKFGFKHTVTLYLIKGDTLRNPVNVLPAFQDNYRYQDSIQIDSMIKPFRFKLRPGENFAKLRTIITGHDQEGEFSPINFHVRLNGKPIYQKRLWKTDCDQNPIQPQSGTWIFPRTNWCPGEKVNEIEVHLADLKLESDNEIEIYFGKIETESKEIHAIYSIESHVITYRYKDSFDLALVDIISPSRNPNYRMHNPSCSRIRFLIKNEGSQKVNTFDVKAGYKNGIGIVYRVFLDLMPQEVKTYELNFDEHGDTFVELELMKRPLNVNFRNDFIKAENKSIINI
jgi:hypothetical protein